MLQGLGEWSQPLCKFWCTARWTTMHKLYKNKQGVINSSKLKPAGREPDYCIAQQMRLGMFSTSNIMHNLGNQASQGNLNLFRVWNVQNLSSIQLNIAESWF